MNIPCFRCGKKIDTPDSSNADYILASDTIVKEPREVLFALKQNEATLAKRTKIIGENTITLDSGEKVPPTEGFICSQFQDSEYDAFEIPNVETAKDIGADLVKVVVATIEKDIQKTGIICPDCYKDTDFIIWGVHKKVE